MFHSEFELTNRCNTRCIHCPHETMSRPLGLLTWETFETVTDKISRHVGQEKYSLSFSGMGEPLLHPLLPRFVAHVSGRAFTGFSTNGSALTESAVAKLIEAGLDKIYFSFNGDEPVLFSHMMGGLKFDRVMQNLRRTVALSRGTRLQVSANISVTKANRHRLTQITQLLKDEGLNELSYAMAHTRGGNLHDPAVFDTPAIPSEIRHCEVIRNTLFIDWRGKALICDHDLHGEYGLGDLTIEPLAAVLARRQDLADKGVDFKICSACNDFLKMGTDLFPDLHDGTLRDWVYDVYREDEDSASQMDPKMRWLHQLYEREGRSERMVARLLARISYLEVRNPDPQRYVDRITELEAIAKEREQRVIQLEAERREVGKLVTWSLVRFEKILRRYFREKNSRTDSPRQIL